MAKKVSKRKAEERKEKLALAKKQRIILACISIPAFLLTVTLVVLYATIRFSNPWLFMTTALAWFALGALFVYAAVKKWGYVTVKGDPCEKNSSVITVYNIILLFALGALFTVLFIRELII